MTVQEAIETIQKMLEVYTSECRTLMNYQITALEMAIEALTHFNSTSNSIKTELSCLEKPNRSEPLTDKEQRIFLSAMERERKVCKQVDEEWRDCREPYEDSLVNVCNEIERKVKGALWGGN